MNQFNKLYETIVNGGESGDPLVKAIMDIIYKYEDSLSDGFNYYAGYGNDPVRDMSIEISKLLQRDSITEGASNSADKKGSKGKIASWNKHRNKEETRISSKASRRRGKEYIRDAIKDE